MHIWPNSRLTDLLGMEFPIVQAPMLGVNGSAMAAAVCEAGGVGSLPCAMIGGNKIRAEIGVIRQRSSGPLNVKFFCHTPPKPDPEKVASWKARLREHYIEFGIDPDAETPVVSHAPFGEETCGIVEDLKCEVVSFHFSLYKKSLVGAGEIRRE